jgi:hypothetical protein
MGQRLTVALIVLLGLVAATPLPAQDEPAADLARQVDGLRAATASTAWTTPWPVTRAPRSTASWPAI